MKAKAVQRFAVVPHGSVWAIFFATTDRELYGQIVGTNGPVGEPQKIELSTQVALNQWDNIFDLSAVETPAGPALALGSSAGAYLIRLDSSFGTRSVTRFSDTKLAHTYYRTPLGWNGEEFCIPWLGADNSGDRLFVSYFDRMGTLAAPARILSESVEFMAIPTSSFPVAHGKEFLFVWSDNTNGQHEVRLAAAQPLASKVDSRVIFKGKEIVGPLALGALDSTAKVMILDRAKYPFRVLIKDVRLVSN